jgi:UDP-N-acetylmuramate dehydrogenase
VLSRLEPAHVKAEQILQAVCEIRRAKLPDPAVLCNAGSFFKNPVVSETQNLLLKKQFPALIAYPQSDQTFKLAAGWLIERCGWKGKRLGAVGVHDRQALVLVNYGGARVWGRP